MTIAEYLLFTDVTADQFANLCGFSRASLFEYMAGRTKMTERVKRLIVAKSGHLITMKELNGTATYQAKD